MSTSAEAPPEAKKKGFIQSEDWLAVLLGGLILFVTAAASFNSRAADFEERLKSINQAQQDLKSIEPTEVPRTEESGKKLKSKEEELKKLSSGLFNNPFKSYVADTGSWNSNPLDAFVVKKKSVAVGLVGVFVISLVVFGLGGLLRGEQIISFVGAFFVLFLLAMLSYVLAGQNVIKYYNLEYALWALMTGMVISNTIGTPKFLLPAIRTELYIKTGLVLLGAEVLISRLLALGLPGVFVSWVVTPITLITTYLFGQYVLKIPSKSLNMVISADMSVCGVSAAIATGAACRAKKEELSLAIGISLAFTAIMMVVMPMVIKSMEMNQVLAGAWLGGTIDSTGAVAAAGGMLGPVALEVAVTIKMIQNILIGVVAFGVAVYWVTFVERDEKGPRLGLMEIWYRFPKFVLGFVAASIVFSAIYSSGIEGIALTETTIGTGKVLRGWFFCLAFVSIGLETNFRELSHYLRDGKAITLYVCGQTLNLALTLLMAWVMFEIVFPQAAQSLSR
ncbi:MAG TPA: putative sulfate exporter family transporter [Schlesneria sp.]